LKTPRSKKTEELDSDVEDQQNNNLIGNVKGHLEEIRGWSIIVAAVIRIRNK
jgi:hypothetical protein